MNNPDENNEEVSEIDNGKTITDEIDTVINERDQYKNIAQRAQADLINYKNRVAEEREATYVMIVSRFVSNLLPIIDNFNRAISSMPCLLYTSPSPRDKRGSRMTSSA